MLVILLSLSCYFGAGALSAVHARTQKLKLAMLMLAIVAAVLHAHLLHHWIDVAAEQNLSIVNMLSLTLWLMALLMVVLSYFWRLSLLSAFVFPMSALTIILERLTSDTFLLDTQASTVGLFHIIFAVLTVSLLCVAAVQAIFLAVQELCLRFKKESLFIQRLPALETMEQLLFCMVGIGFVMLSILIASSLYYYHLALLGHKALLQKTMLAMAAWLLLAIVLMGRRYAGWRGLRAIVFTLFGVLLSVTVYFISQLVLEAMH